VADEAVLNTAHEIHENPKTYPVYSRPLQANVLGLKDTIHLTFTRQKNSHTVKISGHILLALIEIGIEIFLVVELLIIFHLNVSNTYLKVFLNDYSLNIL